MSESQIGAEIRQKLSRGPARLFRCNVGTGWAGGGRNRKATRVTPANLAGMRAELRPGDVVVPNARPLHAGLAKGNGDYVGWVSREITPEMVGQRVAVFASLEVKVPGQLARPEQRNWRDQVTAAGGLAGVADSVEKAHTLLGLPPEDGL